MAQTKWHHNRWLKRYNFLKEIYERFGTSDIKWAKQKENYRMGIEPQLVEIYSFKEIKLIALWIMRQRSIWKNKVRFPSGVLKMNQEKMILLNEIKFPFVQIYKRNNAGRFYKPKDVFCKDSVVSHTTLKRFYKKLYWDSDLKGCELKGCLLHNKIPLWAGKRLTIQLDHKNGNPSDNRRCNLRFLCANCHSLTDTFNGGSIIYNKTGKRMKRINKKGYNGRRKVYCIKGMHYIISKGQATGKNFQGNMRA